MFRYPLLLLGDVGWILPRNYGRMPNEWDLVRDEEFLTRLRIKTGELSMSIYQRVGRWGVILLIWGLPATAADAPKLNENLEKFRPLLGKTWRGEFKNSTPEKPMVDIARWERALNGQAIRVLHSINQGVYGGETIITWSPEKKGLVYTYFTTAGFQTSGTMTWSGSKYTSLEKVTGDAQGVTEVKAIGELLPDGTLVTSSEYLKNGKWESGHSAVYREDPKAEVVFK